MTTILTLLSTCTGVLLAPLAFLSIISGYCMKSPSLTGILTLGILGEYSICAEIHTLLTPEPLALVGSVHAVVTAELLNTKYRGLSITLKILLTIYRTTTWILVTLTVTIVVTHVLIL